jgi:hypothetical protein
MQKSSSHNVRPCRVDKGLGKHLLIKLSPHLGVLNYYYIYPKESRDLTPYSESPVQALQELNGVSRAKTEPPKGTLVPRLRPPVAEMMTVECWSDCWSDCCCYSDDCPRDRPCVLFYRGTQIYR